jgi:uncharacterized C2H2 Zn-finger protein
MSLDDLNIELPVREPGLLRLSCRRCPRLVDWQKSDSRHVSAGTGRPRMFSARPKGVQFLVGQSRILRKGKRLSGNLEIRYNTYC